MPNIRFVIKVLGILFILESLFMSSAVVVAYLYQGNDFMPLLISSLIMLSTGILFTLVGQKAKDSGNGRREGMLIVTLTWLLLSFLGMLPYYIGGYVDSLVDAYFETISGFTTTGASIITDIEALPKGLLFWRSLTQWQGGIGVVVFTVAILPVFGGCTSQMFEAETTGITHERFLPRITQVAKRIWGVYALLTLCIFLLFLAGPMDFFDAINHAFTSISTGGYSTKNTSLAYWNSAYIEYVSIIAMFLGSVNMTLIYFCFKGDFKKLFKDEEFRWFTGFVITTSAVLAGWIFFNHYAEGEHAIRTAIFQVVTLISSTGYTTDNYIKWGPFVWFIALVIMFIAGCAGSTSGGLKMSRFVILTKNLSNVFKKQTHPHAVIPVRINGRPISSDLVYRIMAFTFAYLALIIISCLFLSFSGIGFEESIGATVSCIGNIGPALGNLGPINNYSEIPEIAKWYLGFLMMVGRLEIFTVLTILTPGFWKQ
ncbi:MAG: TrkH family potassium uptake protein [Massilibacteroides sp.]|nr:TrkH family potassium uptake protein [Massilibacteroides sp.]MDD3062217.1 TrkH family potassium uptake protein [Massilibacteroides sp.]MDD4115970.1 TrkH family potassium uptake protein [Massilibacteroides sp.]MDD4659734.1 TrkH family potassium uptake protein [Massilibacteroides sp.]